MQSGRLKHNSSGERSAAKKKKFYVWSSDDEDFTSILFALIAM
jgi:hypothetical protein